MFDFLKDLDNDIRDALLVQLRNLSEGDSLS